MDEFKSQFVDAGMKRFGSGWIFLILEDGKLKWKTTSNADNPVGDAIKIKFNGSVIHHIPTTYEAMAKYSIGFFLYSYQVKIN